ncbi:arsenic resistance protein [Streptomyces lonarensis]|uniref:Arsenic resistance protein n=1 Tax=Streptomyces lonarensis TaxID=700599 RepID=A0A7X6D3A5_9ACTN|nr:arsenic resistance protein [Streptomyces lonarensis]NJQ07400.1 arsenic resistance protein [Streptomyces lonarensis]
MAGLTGWLDRFQVALYAAAVAAGAVWGLLAPGAGAAAEPAVVPVLVGLLYVTFLQVPAGELLRSLRAGRFLGAALVVNFAVVPLVVLAMFPLLPGDPAIRLGVLLVLLCPCVDYVIAFCRLAGGGARRLLAATPLLLVAQLVLLPGFLVLFLGSELAEVVEAGPFVEAFVTFIVVPLALAWLTQLSARVTARVAPVAEALMVPLMIGTLLLVVASQLPKLDGGPGVVLGTVPFFAAFLVVMAVAGRLVARGFGLGAPDGRAVVFTGATRNGLVLLPLALALPDELAVVAVVMVTQTLVEVVGMVVYVHAVPRLLPDRPAGTGGSDSGGADHAG